MEELLRVLSLQDLNTRVVLFGTTLLGIASGIIGTFALLRKRALMGDALSHAAYPGLCGAFLFLGTKDFLGLLAGALVSCIAAIALISFLGHRRRIDEDSLIGIVLSSFFGFGVCLSRVIQNNPTGNQAGLDSFIYGKAASMLYSDALLAAAVCATMIIVAWLFLKEFFLVSFDPSFARSTGWPTKFIDFLLLAAIVVTTIVGLQAVGVVLIIALLITPAATARLWSNSFSRLAALSAFFGGASALVGSIFSALYSDLPTGPLIVLTAAIVFFVSLVIAPERGLLARLGEMRRLRRKTARQNLLRSIYEAIEARHSDPAALASWLATSVVTIQELERRRTWSANTLREELNRLRGEQLITQDKEFFRLTEAGVNAATEIVRTHRLWEIFLITQADIAPSHVDTTADRIEHVLSPDMVKMLEEQLEKDYRPLSVPVPGSPHMLPKPEGGR